jgi:hypothetical protein
MFHPKKPQVYLFPRVINTVKLTTNLTGLFESINLYKIKSLEYDNVSNPLITIGNIDFTHLHSLNLSRSGITNLHGLKNLPVLKISSCSDLEDISDLGNNKVVSISWCSKIQSFSALQGVPHVYIDHCHGRAICY